MLLMGAFSPVMICQTNCPRPPIEPCAEHHGRYSTQNGITQRIWLVGTKRSVRVEGWGFLPTEVEKYTDMTSLEHSYIFGDFEICPLEPDQPGHSRAVCVISARNLVIQNLQGLRPPFRIASTWDRRLK